MKNVIRISGVILLIFMINSCKKNDDIVIKDIDGNVYTSVTIGAQVWMVENLKTTKYRKMICLRCNPLYQD
jgi:ribosomal protein S11